MLSYLRSFVWLTIFSVLALMSSKAFSEDPQLNLNGSLKLLSTQLIWDAAPHNAFTDLIRLNDRWFCAFREGEKHVSPDGALRIITSQDGKTWQSAARIESANSDLRDAKLTVTPDGRLMLCGAGALHDRSQKTHQSLAWFSSDGFTWSDPVEIGDPNVWLWRVTWHRNLALGIGYGCGDDRFARLYQSKDGTHFDTLVDRLFTEGYPNESSIVFDGQKAICLLRRDGNPNTAQIGTALPPYTHWDWKDLGVRIGGPHMLLLPDGRLIAAVRLLTPKPRTSLCWIDPDQGTLTEALQLPSGGDTSYAGLVLDDKTLWVSYYSSHESKTSIYLSKVEVPTQAIDIASQRELFVDHFLIDRLNNTELKLHEPKLTEPMSQPANSMEYGTIIKDGDLYRLYTRDGRGAKADGDSSEVTRYCESNDGIHWTKPNLNLHEIDGSKENNVILHESPFCHNFAPFLDRRPGIDPAQKYKALAGTVKSGPGLVAFVSADGIHWSKLQQEPVITYTKEYAFDSQNVSFWSEAEGCYVCYFRHFLDGKLRSVCRTTSEDFIHWSEPVPQKPNFPGEHIYTTLTQPYFRAPHIYLATPTRFHPERGESTDIIFMSARVLSNKTATRFDRTFREAWIRPGLDPERWGNRSNYAAWNIVQTSPTEMSIYTTPFRRFTMRLDGIASLHAGADRGDMITKPLRFSGNTMEMNYATSAGGYIKVELLDENNHPITGFELDSCKTLVGDRIEQIVSWKQNADLKSLVGKVVRLRFEMQEADLFSFRFFDPSAEKR
jgi:hypothetical protein